MSNSTNRAMGRIAKETYAEKKSRIQLEFLKNREAYEAKKIQESKAKNEQRLVKTSTFKMTATDITNLKEVSDNLGITPSEFVRDSVREAINVLHMDSNNSTK